MSVSWTITNPGGAGNSSFSALDLSDPEILFRAGEISTASTTATRRFDSTEAWWADDEVVTIYRDGSPYFTGRVQESPVNASDTSESRALTLADAWKDLKETTYQEPWPIGVGTSLYPRCILGMDSAGNPITTGQQIGEAVDFAISRGAVLVKGTIDAGLQIWPSEVKNSMCDSVITEEMRFHPDWGVAIDHSTATPTFTAREKANLDVVTIDIADGDTSGFKSAKVTRNVPKGVRIIYESAKSIDSEVFREAYVDQAGDTSGRKVMVATIDLEGMKMQFQKSQVQTLTLPSGDAPGADPEAKAYLKKKFPALTGVADASWSVSNFTKTLVPEDAGNLPEPVCDKAARISVADATDLPRELVKGSIAEWMRKKVGRVNIVYDFEIEAGATDAERKILKNFEGEDKTFTITATNAVTKLYKGISSFTEGEDRPVGIAAAVFAAATADQYEGGITVTKKDVEATRWHGNIVRIVNGANVVMPGAIVHSAEVAAGGGSVSISFGPAPYLSSGDFMELQRMFSRRPATWMSAEERTSNELGAQGSAGSKGDTVDGFDAPDTVTPPGGGGGESAPTAWQLKVQGNSTDGWTWAVKQNGGTIMNGTNGHLITVATFDDPQAISADKWIVAESELELGVPGTFVISAVDEADSKEVAFDAATPFGQTKVRLRIGKITFDGSEASKTQFCSDSQIITDGFLNGKLCKMLASHPSA